MSISTLRRQVKNVALNYTDAQVKVREATSNDPWGPTTALMSEIADMTHNPMQFTEIMTMIWKRLNDHGKNWRHVYKSLVLLDYLIKCGSERVAHQCKENIFSIETLKDFQHIEDNRDQGLNVRTKAKQMVTLLQDEEKLKNERARFMLTRKRFIQNGSTGISSDGTRRSTNGRQRTIDSATIADPEFEEARPSSLGEEEMQLQIALALSREECEKEQELRRGDDIRLQIAIEESKRDSTAARSSSLGTPADADASEKPSTSKSQGALNDLLSLGLDEIFNQDRTSSTIVPTGPSTSAQAFGAGAPQNDPWSSPRPSTTIPMLDKSANAFTTPALIPPPVQNDPWTPTTESPQIPHQQPTPNPLIPTSVKPEQELNELLRLTSPAAVVPAAQNDPWAAFEATTSNKPNDSNIAFGNGQQQMVTNIGQQRNNVKTPESFLGENSALVNLNNLLGPTNSHTQPKKAAPTNPFLIGTTASAVAATKNNPFMANERPSPSLNEMMQAKQQQGNSANPVVETNNVARPSATMNSPFGPDGSLI